MTAVARPRKRRRWLQIYVILVVLSALSQTFIWQGIPVLDTPANQRSIDLRAQSATGVIDGDGAKSVRLTYRVYGDEQSPKKVLLLHGSPAPTPNFPKFGPLIENAHVIAIDMPGFGGSEDWVGDYGIAAQAHYGLALMDAIGWEKAHLFGYSMGSGTALEMYDEQPHRIASLTMYGGIGIMEGEGSGDYHFEQLKYRIGYGLIVGGFEFVPHFGLLGKRSVRHAFLSSFMDTDQRPLREVLHDLAAANVPTFILQDYNDPMVPADTAREHHAIVKHSELEMLGYSHMGLFSEAGAVDVAERYNDFLRRASQPDFVPVRRTDDAYAEFPRPESRLPFGWDLRRDMGPWQQISVIVAASYILEDPTTIFTGLMVSAGQVDFFVALFAIFVGIFSGDLLLYLAGWIFGKRALAWGPVAQRLPVAKVEKLGDWFDKHGWTAVLASRFIPGTRLPLYVLAGALGRRPGRFALWTATAVAIWSVVMVVLIGLFGQLAKSPFQMLFGDNWLTLVVTIIVLLIVLRVALMLTTMIGRAKLKASVARVTWWEFWPIYFFYMPVWLYIGWPILRHMGLGVTSAANPGIPHGGYIDESKEQILGELPQDWVLPQQAVASVDDVRRLINDQGWAYPIILKPDDGYRGRGVRKINSDDEAAVYIEQSPVKLVAQQYHPGPYEVGVFYYRYPDEERGQIYSITEKRLPVLEGDGKHTLEELIWLHPRYRMQAGVFLWRFADRRDEILPVGEMLQLVSSGNHCQGAIFLDGARLKTPELEAQFDAIAKQFDGFYFGRFDVRYADEEEFKAGRGFKIIELNGVTSEATHIYDPKISLSEAWSTLCRQWEIAFKIGRLNAKQGAKVTPTWKLVWLALKHFWTRSGSQQSRFAD